MLWKETVWADRDGTERECILIPWWQVEEILGHAYDGDLQDLERLKAAVLEAGAPAWIRRVAYNGIEAEGLCLIGGPIVYAEALAQEYHLWELEDRWGSVEHEGSTWYLTQQPYIAGTDERPWYEAIAIDINGDAVLIKWAVADHWKDIEDESERCEWDKPASVTVL